MGAVASAGLSKSFWRGRMWLLVSSSEICWFSTASGGSALGRLLMFSSGVTSTLLTSFSTNGHLTGLIKTNGHLTFTRYRNSSYFILFCC